MLENHKNDIIKMFKENKSNVEIAKKYNKSSARIGQVLKKWGYKRGKPQKQVIEINCDYCGITYQTTNWQLKKAHKNINKNSCKNCKGKKSKEVFQKLHGVDNISQLPEIKEKIKNTNLKEYGYENVFQSDNIKEQSKKTNLEKYGREYACQASEIIEKIKETMKLKYGHENASQVEELKEKKKQTNLKNWGHENVLSSSKVQEKCRQTMKEKYGVESPAQNNKILQKIKKTVLERYGCENPNQCLEIKNKTRNTRIEKGLTKVYKNKDMRQWAEEKARSYSGFAALVKEHGWEMATSMKKGRTDIEELVAGFLEELGVNFVERKKLCGIIPDFYLPQYKLVIEADGLLHHSDNPYMKQYRPEIMCPNFHKERLEKFKKEELTALFFRGDEIKQKPEIIKSIIRNKIGQTRRIFARKCEIVSALPSFFSTNHLMGKGQGKIFALKYQDEIVCALQFKCRNKKNNEYEISRFCPVLNTTVVGGFSRLLKQAEDTLSPSQIVTFIDKRYGDGRYLKNLGFQFKRCNLSFRWVIGQETVHRMKFRSNSGYEKGFYKIWDCGQAKWSKLCKE